MGATAEETPLQKAQREWLEEREADERHLRLFASVGAEAEPKAAAPLTFWKIAFAVLVGNLMTALIAGVLYAMNRM
jgi:hypothetical protein